MEITSKIIGIDLGTTNSCVAAMHDPKANDIKPVVIKTLNGCRAIPSVVAYADGEQKAPPQICAEVLRKMKCAAEKYLGAGVTEAVIAVPAYFDFFQRQAIKDAGKVAGFKVNYIINASTAAALAYGMDEQHADSTIAVYDLGGGSFDISIISHKKLDGKHEFKVLCTNSVASLGGEDFDLKIIEYLVEEFKQENGIDLNTDRIALQRLKEAAEKAKMELSSSQQYEVNLPHIMKDNTGRKDLVRILSRGTLELLVRPLVERTIDTCKTALKEAGVASNKIDEVILVGMQTRMPLVQETVKNFFGKRHLHLKEPDTMVTRGAAHQAAILSGVRKNVKLSGVMPFLLDIETPGGVMYPLIKKNTDASKDVYYKTSTTFNNQTTLMFHMLLGDPKQPAQNKFPVRVYLSKIPEAKGGVPRIEVRFVLRVPYGDISVSARDAETGKELEVAIHSSRGQHDDVWVGRGEEGRRRAITVSDQND